MGSGKSDLIFKTINRWRLRTIDSTHKGYQSLTYHLYSLHLFTCDNLKDVVGLSLAFALTHARAAPALSLGDEVVSAQDLILRTPAMFLWTWFNLLLFTMHNQRHPSSIAEDAVNKPWRPLASNRMSPSDVNLILYLAYPIITLYSIHVGAFGPFLAETFFSLWYNEWNGSANPVLKNALTATGYIGFMSGPLQIATQHSIFSDGAIAFKWLLIIAGAIFCTVHISDFRDKEGDAATGRCTVIQLLGDLWSRIVAVVSIVAWTLAAFAFWELRWTALLLPSLTGLCTIYHLLRHRTLRGDKLAWKMWPLWLLSFFSMPVMKFCLTA